MDALLSLLLLGGLKYGLDKAIDYLQFLQVEESSVS